VAVTDIPHKFMYMYPNMQMWVIHILWTVPMAISYTCARVAQCYDCRHKKSVWAEASTLCCDI